MAKVTLEVNGKKVSKEVPDHTLLSTFLRDNLNLTGTHVGCDSSQCGACVVHIDGKPEKSGQTLEADLGIERRRGGQGGRSQVSAEH